MATPAAMEMPPRRFCSPRRQPPPSVDRAAAPLLEPTRRGLVPETWQHPVLPVARPSGADRAAPSGPRCSSLADRPTLPTPTSFPVSTPRRRGDPRRRPDPSPEQMSARHPTHSASVARRHGRVPRAPNYVTPQAPRFSDRTWLTRRSDRLSRPLCPRESTRRQRVRAHFAPCHARLVQACRRAHCRPRGGCGSCPPPSPTFIPGELARACGVVGPISSRRSAR